jgi:hypothetical protein
MSTPSDSQAFSSTPETCEDKIRKYPLATVGYAGLIGYLLYILPLGAIVRILFRLVAAALGPALTILGIVKGVEICRPLLAARRQEPIVTDNSEPLLDSPAGPSQEEVLPG